MKGKLLNTRIIKRLSTIIRKHKNNIEETHQNLIESPIFESNEPNFQLFFELTSLLLSLKTIEKFSHNLYEKLYFESVLKNIKISRSTVRLIKLIFKSDIGFKGITIFEVRFSDFKVNLPLPGTILKTSNEEEKYIILGIYI